MGSLGTGDASQIDLRETIPSAGVVGNAIPPVEDYFPKVGESSRQIVDSHPRE